MKRSITLAVATVLTAFSGYCLGQQVAASTPKTLRGSDAAQPDQGFQEKSYVGDKPGAQKNLPRSFRDAPPLIPHALPRYDEISLGENKCLSCHSPDTYKEKDAPRVGDSHMTFVDTQDGMKRIVNMSRYQCTSCHVPQADAKPLVDNAFVSDIPPR